MLPVGGKPLIVHAVESLAMAGLKAATVVVSGSANALKENLGDGTRWGMQFDYLSAGPAETPDDIVRRLGLVRNGDFLVVRGEILRTPVIEEFMALAQATEHSTVAATIGGIPAGVRLVRNSFADSPGLPDDPASPDKWRENVPALELSGARLSLIESLAAYHQANMQTISGQFPGLIIPGRQLTPGVVVGRGTSLPARAIKGQPILVGCHCHIAADAELMSGVVLSDNVLIDRRATLRSAVIMPDSYVGQLVDISDAIVDGNTLIHIDTGAITQVTDSFLLTNVRAHSIASFLRGLLSPASAIKNLSKARLRNWLWAAKGLKATATDRVAFALKNLLPGSPAGEKSSLKRDDLPKRKIYR